MNINGFKNLGNGNQQISKAMKRNLERGEHRRSRHSEASVIQENLREFEEIENAAPVWAFAQGQEVA